MTEPRYVHEVIRWVEGQMLADRLIELANERAEAGWRLHSWAVEHAQSQNGVCILAVFERERPDLMLALLRGMERGFAQADAVRER